MEPLVSVIIPVYNVKSYLCECVDSVINQTYKNIEIILVDDGSTDGSGEICDNYALSNDNVIVLHTENGGLSRARNNGIGKASGEFVWFVDSDDYIAVDAVSKLVSTAKEQNTDLIFFNAHSFLDEGGKMKQSYLRKKEYSYDSGIGSFSRLMNNNEYLISACLIFVSSDLLKENKITFVDGILYEDMVFTFQTFLCAKRCAYMSDMFYERRYRSGSIVTKKKNLHNFMSCVTVLKKVLETVQKNDIAYNDSINKYLIRCSYAIVNCYREINGLDKRQAKKTLTDVKALLKKTDYFNSLMLRIRYIGYYAWLLARVMQKIVTKIGNNK